MAYRERQARQRYIVRASLKTPMYANIHMLTWTHSHIDTYISHRTS